MTAKTTTDLPEAPVAAPTVLTMGRLPYNISLFDNALKVFAQSAVLIRAGYIYMPSTSPLLFPNGTASVMLSLGSPDQEAYDDAKAAADSERAAEEAEFEARVQAAAKQIVDAAAKAARDAEIQAKITEQRRALAVLEAAVGAA